MTTKENKCSITGVRLTEEDTYNINSGCPYSNFAEKFRAKHKIPVADLREFVDTLKEKQTQCDYKGTLLEDILYVCVYGAGGIVALFVMYCILSIIFMLWV